MIAIHGHPDKIERSGHLSLQAPVCVMNSPMQRSSKVPPLTSLRFFAALYVVLYHTLERVFVGVKDLSTVHGRLLDLGYVSVSFFFVLSGYILAFSYLPREVSKRPFWRARFARIYPLFLLTLLIDCPHFFAGIVRQVGFHAGLRILLERLIENMLLLQAWAPAMRTIDWPNWSLSTEAFFYLVFPLVVAYLARPKVRALAVATALVYAAGMGFVTVAMHSHLPLDVLKYNPLFHLHVFLCGALLGAIRTKTRLIPRLAPAFLCAAVACLVLTVHYYHSIPMPLLHDGLLVPAFGCLILAFDSGNKRLDGLLSVRWLVVLGEASYGLYLIHIPLWDIFYHLRIDQSRVAYPVYLVCAVALSVLSFFYVETPLRRLLTQRTVSAERIKGSRLRWRPKVAIP
jgi:peptidoglycan/LPS O-acetylase OafA/YrhL